MKHTTTGNPPQDYSLLTRQRITLPSLLPMSVPARMFTLAFVIFDFLVLKNMTNLIFTDSFLMIWGTALAGAAILDVPMAMVGNVWKQCKAGTRSRREGALITIICALAFLLMFSLCVSLRIVMKNVLFSDVGTFQSGLVDLSTPAADAQADNSAAVLTSALFMALFPLATSLASLGVGYYYSDPIGERLNLLYARRASLQEALAQMDAALEECGDLEAEVFQAQQREEALYQEFLASIDIQAAELKQKARLLLMEKLSSPESITLLTERAQALCREPVSTQPALPQPEPIECPISLNHIA